ncbi:serine/arginine repetitive matrix protein 1 [Prunus yedoensis var. nudiflora]|uniref:Serine/arginine repetitive matrix protein 1 n=1 Tax=Prunus yedoensis var. nudiflora TaxID=2094558 RepID=A0A314ZLH6_PRUYE|nr:serine/arginine repetitive matrix protein 1 [Prunus yedoensis var. nudiflora]
MMWLHVQESDKYKSMVQQHVDLETIQSKLHKDTYSSCALSFYRDLLLLFNNAVVFFPKSSLESLTAHQLRRLVLNEMKKNNLITRPPPTLHLHLSHQTLFVPNLMTI